MMHKQDRYIEKPVLASYQVMLLPHSHRMRNELALCSKIQQLPLSVYHTLFTHFATLFTQQQLSLRTSFLVLLFPEGRGILGTFTKRARSLNGSAKPL